MLSVTDLIFVFGWTLYLFLGGCWQMYVWLVVEVVW